MLLESFAPVIAENARILILGSMPGDASLQAAQYYAHPRNNFWPFLCAFAGVPVPKAYDARLRVLLENGIGVWDVLKHCSREGSLDSAIHVSTEQVNDFLTVLLRLPKLKIIAFNGKKAEQSFIRHVVKPGVIPLGNIELVSLPSTSPANASIALEVKRASWLETLNKGC